MVEQLLSYALLSEWWTKRSYLSLTLKITTYKKVLFFGTDTRVQKTVATGSGKVMLKLLKKSYKRLQNNVKLHAILTY